jgi:multicomponent Na+:H+ antiporter subunit B
MTRRTRIILFAVGAAGLAVLLAFGVAGLHPFGHYPGPYGDVITRVAPQERRTANVVASVVFDYRGFDTMGEELILFAAVMGVAVLLRESREEDVEHMRDATDSDALRAVGLVASPVVVVLSLYVIAHGYLTPGGGFQGGVVGAAGLLLVYLAAEWRALRRAGPQQLVDAGEAAGAAGFVAVGVAMLAAGGAFLENLLPLGKFGTLTSTGMIPIVNWCAGLEVAAAFVLLFMEFVTEVLVERKQDGMT